MHILYGKSVCEKIYQELTRDLQPFDEMPKLLSIVIGDDPVSITYARAKGKKVEALGAHFELLHISASESQEEIENRIRKSIKSLDPDGVIIEKPIPADKEFAKLSALIPKNADVDCQRLDSLGLLLSGNPLFVPATAGAVIEMLRFYNIDTFGKDVVIVGRSMTVGLPLAVMLLSKSECANATVTVCHSCTADIAKHTRNAEIVVVAAGKPKLLTADMISEGATVIDVGTNYVGDKLVGDVYFDGISQKAYAASPVPGGVGPMTITMLMKNTVMAAKLAAGLIKL